MCEIRWLPLLEWENWILTQWVVDLILDTVMRHYVAPAQRLSR
ncbi:MAG: hypothetical protein R3351_06305 [Nitrospirales bacterium]|nr:hypothetical protein [Nitrospirales bacterium]